MAEILVRGLTKQVVDCLKARAKRHGRSLQGEAKMILERAAAAGDTQSALKELRQFRRSLGRTFGDSAELIREDRQR